MNDSNASQKGTSQQDVSQQSAAPQSASEWVERAAEHTEEAIAYMKQFGVEPEGHIRPFLPPDTRQASINRIPYTHNVKQQVVYETEPGEFSARCPFSGLPDFGTVRVEYVPGDWILELKSLKYYFVSWRDIGAAQEDITAIVFEDIMAELANPEYLVVETVYNVRGGINTTCTADSRSQ
ncbi:MAG: preQ(1) synthase [Longimonas sp.]|uniref:preQ(1) synthase n=1 Tax=Longimonas sp. TaxID=2039626 RepID=UPI00334C9917